MKTTRFMENVVQTLSMKIVCVVCTLSPLPSSYPLLLQLAYVPDSKFKDPYIPSVPQNLKP